MRILIADDHTLFRQGLQALLEDRGHEVVAQASDGEEAVRLAGEHDPDVVLLDLYMQGRDGLDAVRGIRARGSGAKIVMLTISEDEEHLFEAIKAGADGYLIKDIDADQLLAALDHVTAGQPAITPRLARQVLAEFDRKRPAQRTPERLTDRETEVLTALVDGATSNRELAERLRISENTVKFHLRNIFEKLHVHNRAEVVAYAFTKRLVKPRPE